jgi:hypothetical protein
VVTVQVRDRAAAADGNRLAVEGVVRLSTGGATARDDRRCPHRSHAD